MGGCDVPIEETSEVIQIEDIAQEPSMQSTPQWIAAELTPSAKKHNCCFKCAGAGPWWEIKLGDGCNAYAKGYCAGQYNAGVRSASWSNKCPP